MKSVIARQLVSPGNTSVYEVTSKACAACTGCNGNTRITLPGVSAPVVTIGITTRSEWLLLVNSWGKPLIAVVAMSFLCSLVQITEAVSVGLIVLAFFAGVLCCQRVPAAAITLSTNS